MTRACCVESGERTIGSALVMRVSRGIPGARSGTPAAAQVTQTHAKISVSDGAHQYFWSVEALRYRPTLTGYAASAPFRIAMAFVSAPISSTYAKRISFFPRPGVA